jgi:hypothetical protein
MLMIKLTLIATLANAHAMKPVLWTLDGNNIGNRSSIVTDIPANSGTHEVCATLDKTTRCIKFAAKIETKVTLPVAMD